MKSGYKSSLEDVIRGYLLVHPSHGIAFNYIDGHHRMTIIEYLNENEPNQSIQSIDIGVLSVVHRERLLKNPLTNKMIKKGYFTESDVYTLFDYVFLSVLETSR